MITLKRCNYFTGNPHHVGYTIKHIIDFLENEGVNYLLISPPDNIYFDRGTKKKKQGITTNLRYLLSNQITFKSFNEFNQILSNKSNLFRVNLLVFDFSLIGKFEMDEYKKVINNLGIDYLIASNEYHYINDGGVNDFHVRTEYKDLSKSETYITDNINKWTSSLKELEISYIRDIKINTIIKNK
jgi:hypothetical protein